MANFWQGVGNVIKWGVGITLGVAAVGLLAVPGLRGLSEMIAEHVDGMTIEEGDTFKGLYESFSKGLTAVSDFATTSVTKLYDVIGIDALADKDGVLAERHVEDGWGVIPHIAENTDKNVDALVDLAKDPKTYGIAGTSVVAGMYFNDQSKIAKDVFHPTFQKTHELAGQAVGTAHVAGTKTAEAIGEIGNATFRTARDTLDAGGKHISQAAKNVAAGFNDGKAHKMLDGKHGMASTKGLRNAEYEGKMSAEKIKELATASR